jgi:peptidoglycan/xylan/chitin deacetylase (PgdA/CDA1 family)
MRLARPFFLAPILFREALFRIETTEKILCLTFDDGPDRNTTLPLLEIIERYGVQALFFCTGTMAEANPDIINRIRSGGHRIGNHGYDHLSGFRTPSDLYIDNVQAASGLTSSKIFRPPYGQITPTQYRILSHSFRIVFWDVMAYDFDPAFGYSRSLKILRTNIRTGSIIVLHDKPRSSAPLFLEDFLNFALSEGYRFEIPADLDSGS